LGIGITSTGRTYEYKRGPPGSLEGIRRYYAERGYNQDPFWESKEDNQVASFVKPIPGETGQSRHHIRVIKKRGHYLIDEHVDRYDPERNQLGHLVDIVDPPPHNRFRVPKND
jgi:hypothetical protein